MAIAVIDGSGEQPVDLPAGDYILPAFSPDGSRIAFLDLSKAGDQATALVIDRDGTDLQRLGGGESVALNPLFWSPDGEFVVAYAVDLLKIRLFAVTVDGGAAVSPVSVALGASSGSELSERASWQRLAP